ncbi:MAG: FAD-dependent oxidoreductase [Ktedonobacteraceae bacterium]|nr:FAD-dependent oxidoreductase [Ktedonobacteraceae bacterium]
MHQPIAIIGAGSSGLAAAHTLRDAGYPVTIFELSSSVGGRATTRQLNGFTYDHGAQYIKQGSPASVSLITNRFRLPDLLDIAKPVWTFDSAGTIREGDPVQNAEPKWTYRGGLISLFQHMATGLDVRLHTSVASLHQQGSIWHLLDQHGQPLGSYQRVLITAPAPQALTLIQASRLDDTLHQAIHTHLSAAQYNPLISIMLGYRPAPSPRPYYALVNTDRQHPISWLAWEHEKAPERVPPGSGLLLAQMAPGFSRQHDHSPDSLLYQEAANLVTTLLNEALPEPCFQDIQRWPYALPATRADANALNTLTMPTGLAFCGDSFVGGRVHLSLEHGIDVARTLIATT